MADRLNEVEVVKLSRFLATEELDLAKDDPEYMQFLNGRYDNLPSMRIRTVLVESLNERDMLNTAECRTRMDAARA